MPHPLIPPNCPYFIEMHAGTDKWCFRTPVVVAGNYKRKLPWIFLDRPGEWRPIIAAVAMEYHTRNFRKLYDKGELLDEDIDGLRTAWLEWGEQK
ncbi:MAG: hypothetical protein ABIH23_08320 [bacterium]